MPTEWINLPSAKPHPTSFSPTTTAVIIIDMQRDFLEPDGFGAVLGNDVSRLARAVEPCAAVLAAAREAGMMVIHTREGHRADMADVHTHKNTRRGLDGEVISDGPIGTEGKLGRILIRGEAGHDIIPRLYPREGEPVIDKPGKGSFYATDLEAILQARSITTLIVCGVTTEVCCHTTVREANDRGIFCIVAEDACASYIPEFHEAAIKMIWAQGGIFGSVIDSKAFVDALSTNSE